MKKIEEAFRNYFANLFTSTLSSSHDIGICTNRIRPKVSVEMNTKLLKSFIREEVEKAFN